MHFRRRTWQVFAAFGKNNQSYPKTNKKRRHKKHFFAICHLGSHACLRKRHFSYLYDEAKAIKQNKNARKIILSKAA
jgi:hypothetical protein